MAFEYQKVFERSIQEESETGKIYHYHVCNLALCMVSSSICTCVAGGG